MQSLRNAPPTPTPVEPLNNGDPFAGAFYPGPGNRVDVAAGGPFAEGLKLLGKGVSPLTIDASREAMERSTELLRATGHQGELPKYAVNINLDNISDPTQINGMILDVANELAPQVDEARRGVRSNTETLAAAHELFRREEGFMLKRGVGEAFNAEQITATRYVLASAREKTSTLKNQILAGDTSPETLVSFRRALSQQAAVQLQLHGMAAEAGRALQAFNIVARSGEMNLSDPIALTANADNVADLQSFLDSMGGQQAIVDMAKAYHQLPDAAAQNAFARESTRRGAADMVGELFYNFVLSGPATHVVNMTGNAITLGTLTAERAVAAQWGKLFGMVGRDAGVKQGEAAAMTQAYWSALGDAWRLANFAFRHGDSAGSQTGYRMPLSVREVWQMSGTDAAALTSAADGATSKLTTGKQPAITGENVINTGAAAVNAVSKRLVGRDVLDPSVIGERGALGRMTDLLSHTIDLAGGVLRTPTRALGAEDQFWKTLAYRGELSARAWREAQSKGLTGADLRDYVDQAVNFMSPLDDKAAEKFARTVTMTESLQAQVAKGAQMIGGSNFGYLIAPFVRVTANILDFSTQRMAFPARPKWWGELFSDDPATRDLALAKASTGALMWATAYATASTMYDPDEDAPIVATGSGPQNPQERAIWMKRGYKPYSIRVGGKGGKWVQYSRLDPAGQMLGIAADTINIMSEMDEVTATEFGASLIAGIGNNVVNKTFMQATADGMEVFTSFDPERYIDWAQRTVASHAVPNVVSQITQAQDPYMTKAVGVAQEIQKRLSADGKRQLPRVRDLEGKPIKQEWLFGSRFTGIAASDDKPDPVADELWRLEMPFSKPDRNVRGMELDEFQFDRYQQLAGYALKMPKDTQFVGAAVPPNYELVELDLSGLGMWEALGALIKHPLYKKATDGADPPGQKAAMIAQIRDMYRDAAATRLLSERPELVEKMVDARRKTYKAKGIDPQDMGDVISAERETLAERINQVKSFEVIE